MVQSLLGWLAERQTLAAPGGTETRSRGERVLSTDITLDDDKTTIRTLRRGERVNAGSPPTESKTRSEIVRQH